MKKNNSTLILLIIFFIGLSLLLYPSFSDYWNSFHQSRAIANYAASVGNIERNEYERIWNEAVYYNSRLAETKFNLELTGKEKKEYDEVLDVSGTGIMAYIEIPQIKCSLPIYHGTSEGVLQIAIGHIAGTSLPVGGDSTHCVLSGHRGLPSARLFTDIDQMAEGDIFQIRTLNETLTYEVDRISIVLPAEVDILRIEEGEDLCSLVTCTPYGINTHRLIVRGHRIETVDSSRIRVTADALQIDEKVVAFIVAVPILLVLLMQLLFGRKKHRTYDDEYF